MRSNEYEKLIASGDAVAMRELAAAYVEADDESKFDEALELMERAAELGDAESQSDWADICRSKDNPDASFKWEKMAADQGFPRAQYNLAIHYRDGIGTSENLETAFNWFLKAAENGYMDAKHSVGVCYLTAQGTKENYEAAFYWLEQAANEGHPNAKARVGTMYIMGMGVGANEEKGMAFVREAAALGDDRAKDILRESGEPEDGSGKVPKKGGCYVATCVYGSYDCPEVWTLRRYRDDTLSASWLGRRFIQAYYAVSPKIVALFGRQKWFTRLCKPMIDKLVNKLQNCGIDNGAYFGM